MNDRPGRCIAVFGTASDVGKSVITTALCRIFANRGILVAPFKAQNMSNNSGVTPDGLEMGRAQIVQAEAAGIAPHVDMNPVLLKPAGGSGSQVVLFGKALGNRTARAYFENNADLFAESCAALDRLRSRYDVVVIEGAGSCAEVNLMASDFVNFRMADYSRADVILVADIDKGGVFAQIVGTLACLPPQYRKLVKGVIINRFRGDIALFADGVEWLGKKAGVPILGIVPWFPGIRIEAEDSVAIEHPDRSNEPDTDGPSVSVIRLPFISNFTDFDPLAKIEGLDLRFIERPRDLSGFSGIILPGSKNVRADLKWLSDTGWKDLLLQYVHSGGHILGICGGYQIMGCTVEDPEGLEDNPGTSVGLGLLAVKTVLKAPKTTSLSTFFWGDIRGAGYEIHMGRTIRISGDSLLAVDSRNGKVCTDNDGAMSSDGRVMGTYMHGFFDTPEITHRWLSSIGLTDIVIPPFYGLAARSLEYDRLATHVAAHIDAAAIEKWLATV